MLHSLYACLQLQCLLAVQPVEKQSCCLVCQAQVWRVGRR